MQTREQWSNNIDWQWTIVDRSTGRRVASTAERLLQRRRPALIAHSSPLSVYISARHSVCGRACDGAPATTVGHPQTTQVFDDAPCAHVHVPFVTTDTSYSTDVYTQLTPDCNQHHALISLQSTGHRRRTAVQWFQNTRTGHVITIAATLDNHNCLCRKISIKTF